jgi:hypothetical protein
MQPWIDNGYLKQANSIRRFGKNLPNEMTTFKNTIVNYNADAHKGVDP